MYGYVLGNTWMLRDGQTTGRLTMLTTALPQPKKWINTYLLMVQPLTLGSLMNVPTFELGLEFDPCFFWYDSWLNPKFNAQNPSMPRIPSEDSVEALAAQVIRWFTAVLQNNRRMSNPIIHTGGAAPGQVGQVGSWRWLPSGTLTSLWKITMFNGKIHYCYGHFQ